MGASPMDPSHGRHGHRRSIAIDRREGARYVDAAVERIASFIVELHGLDLAQLYE